LQTLAHFERVAEQWHNLPKCINISVGDHGNTCLIA